MQKLTFAGQSYDIAAPTFGNLRKIISSFNIMLHAGMNSDEAMEEAAKVFAIILHKSLDEVNEMPITMPEIMAALAAIPGICGLSQGKDGGAGEATAVVG